MTTFLNAVQRSRQYLSVPRIWLPSNDVFLDKRVEESFQEIITKVRTMGNEPFVEAIPLLTNIFASTDRIIYRCFIRSATIVRPWSGGSSDVSSESDGHPELDAIADEDASSTSSRPAEVNDGAVPGSSSADASSSAQLPALADEDASTTSSRPAEVNDGAVPGPSSANASSSEELSDDGADGTSPDQLDASVRQDKRKRACSR